MQDRSGAERAPRNPFQYENSDRDTSFFMGDPLTVPFRDNASRIGTSKASNRPGPAERTDPAVLGASNVPHFLNHLL
jgi:hypothetical protein